MTLTICIRASDGIILASDSRATSRDPRSETTINDKVKKIFSVGKHSGIGIAGDGGIAMTLIDKLATKISPNDEIGKLVDEFHTFSKDIFNAWFPYESPEDPRRSYLSIILSGYTPKDSAEIYVINSFDNFVPRKSATGFSCLGITYLAEYLLNRFYQPDINLERAAELAAFCIIETASQDGKVGGDLQLASFSSTLEFHEFTLQETETVKKECEKLRERMRLGFIGYEEKAYEEETKGSQKKPAIEKANTSEQKK